MMTERGAKTYSIKLEGLIDPQKFVDEWSVKYDYPNEEKYVDNIETALDNIMPLFEWKNGTGDGMSTRKREWVNAKIAKRDELKKLQEHFDLSEFEALVEPEKGSVIWNIFLLHLINRELYPIFDQHVYRSFMFFTTGKIMERPYSNAKYYASYHDNYIPWFRDLKHANNLDTRKMDKAFFMFGRVLKALRKLPIEIIGTTE